jgi:hypothetical protein
MLPHRGRNGSEVRIDKEGGFTGDENRSNPPPHRVAPRNRRANQSGTGSPV